MQKKLKLGLRTETPSPHLQVLDSKDMNLVCDNNLAKIESNEYCCKRKVRSGHSLDGSRKEKQSKIQRRRRLLESEFIGSFKCYQDKVIEDDPGLKKKKKD